MSYAKAGRWRFVLTLPHRQSHSVFIVIKGDCWWTHLGCCEDKWGQCTYVRTQCTCDNGDASYSFPLLSHLREKSGILHAVATLTISIPFLAKKICSVLLACSHTWASCATEEQIVALATVDALWGLERWLSGYKHRLLLFRKIPVQFSTPIW